MTKGMSSYVFVVYYNALITVILFPIVFGRMKWAYLMISLVCSLLGPLGSLAQEKDLVFVAMFNPLGIAIAVAIGVLFLGDPLYLGRVVGAVIITLGSMMWGKAKERRSVPDSGICSFESSSQRPLFCKKIPRKKNKELFDIVSQMLLILSRTAASRAGALCTGFRVSRVSRGISIPQSLWQNTSSQQFPVRSREICQLSVFWP